MGSDLHFGNRCALAAETEGTRVQMLVPWHGPEGVLGA